MKLASLAGVLTRKPEQNIGLAEIHGALIGGSLDFSALKCTRTTSASRRHVCGLCQGQARPCFFFSPGFFFSFTLINKPLFSLSFLLSSTANNCFHLLACRMGPTFKSMRIGVQQHTLTLTTPCSSQNSLTPEKILMIRGFNIFVQDSYFSVTVYSIE